MVMVGIGVVVRMVVLLVVVVGDGVLLLGMGGMLVGGR